MTLPVEPQKSHRLIVLVPESLAGSPELAHKIFWMARRAHCDVLFLGLIDSDEHALTVSRGLTTMKAITAGNGLVVQIKLIKTALLFKTLREVVRPGDRIVCHEEQSVKKGFLKTVPIAEFLQSGLNFAVIPISGFYKQPKIWTSHWFHSFIAWLGFFLILFFFTAIDIGLDRSVPGFVGKLLLGLVLTLEIGVIWAWDSITN